MSKPVSVALVCCVLALQACGGGDSKDSDGSVTAAAGAADGAATNDGSAATKDTGTAVDATVSGDGKTPDAGTTPDMAAADAAVAKDGGPGGDTNPLLAGVVRGTVAGEVLEYRGRVASDAIGTALLRVGGAKEFAVSDNWALASSNTVGTTTCGAAGIFFSLALTRTEANVMVTYTANNTTGSCTINVTNPATKVGDWAKGTFSGTLVNATTKKEIVVTDGAFEAYRYQ